MRKKLVLSGVALIMTFTLSIPVFAGSTMSWDFEFFNNSYAENTAFNIAQAQADLEKEAKSQMERFGDMITSRILNQISRDIVMEALGRGSVQVGQYIVGQYIIDIATDEEGITVVITDTTTGDTTVLIVPYYNYEYPE